jgi:hypothetical protein
MEAWSPTAFFNRRAYGSENLSPIPQKDFCNTIPSKADIRQCDWLVRFVPILLQKAVETGREA